MTEYDCERCGIHVFVVGPGPGPGVGRYCVECEFLMGLNPEDRARAEDFLRRRERPADEPDDADPHNPVDLTADEWRDVFADPDYPEDDQQP